MGVQELERTIKPLPMAQKVELAEWLLGQIEQDVPADFWVGLRQASEGRVVDMEKALSGPPAE